MNSKNANLNIYEKHNYDPEKQKPKFAEAERIISRISTIPFKPKSKLLDVGCGIGIIGAKFKERYKLDVYGIDLAPMIPIPQPTSRSLLFGLNGIVEILEIILSASANFGF